MKKWIIADAVLGVVGGLAAILGIFTSIKASEAEDENRMKEIGEYYGLTPVSSEGEAE